MLLESDFDDLKEDSSKNEKVEKETETETSDKRYLAKTIAFGILIIILAYSLFYFIISSQAKSGTLNFSGIISFNLNLALFTRQGNINEY